VTDRRLIEKSYGRRLWQSLPPMRRTRVADDAVQFLRAAVDQTAARAEIQTNT
jgi:ATP-dependent DNA helicase DinG